MRMNGKGPMGFVEGEASLELEPAEAGTRVRYRVDLQVDGQIGRLGQRMISGMAKEMAGQFFEALERLEPESSRLAVPPSTLRAFFQLLWRTLLNRLGLSRRS